MTKIKSNLGKPAQQKLVDGINKLANMVKITLGPKGKNVVIAKKFSSPLVTNDGVTIAREFFSSDTMENVGVKIIKEVSQKTNDLAGDGTTTATVLAQNMINEGVKLIENGENPVLINKGIDLATGFLLKKLKKISKEIKTKTDIENTATISCQDEKIGKIIAEAYSKLGKDGTILLQDSPTINTYLTFQDGMKINRGFVSPYFCNDMEKGRFTEENCYLLLFDFKLNNFNYLLPVLELLNMAKKPFVIIAADIDDEVLSGLIVNKMRGNFNCCVVRAPFLAEKRQAILEDIATLTNTKVINPNSFKTLDNITLDDLGVLKQVKITSEETIFSAQGTNLSKIEERKTLIKNQIDACQNDFDKEQLKLRLSNLTGGVATLFVGGQSDVEQKERKLRIEDAISATSSALSEGIIPGGGIAFFRLSNNLEKFIKKMPKEYRSGAEIVKNSLCCPLKQILTNANCDCEKIIEKIKNNKSKNYGYDAMKNVFCNMIKKGIIDPTKVATSALKMASSVAKMILTTDGIICEEE